MASTAIKKHFTNGEEIHMPTYKKLPPIQNVQKMPVRTVISPTSVSVNFNPPDTVQSKQLIGGKVPVRKASVDSIKSEGLKSAANQNAGSKRTSPLGTAGKSGVKSSGDVAFDQSNSGIELIGYRMTNGQPAAAKMPVPQKASDWTPLSSELPPCRICGDKASGLHYGVNTCEACKAFFRRTLKKSAVNFQCTCSPEEKKLGTDEPRKMTCPKCRYERCIKTGMSKDAIKIGRYTISRKRQNDREVKTLKKGEKSAERVGERRVSDSSKSTSSNSPYSTSQSVSSPEELSSDITSLSLQEKKRTHSAKKRRHDDEDGLLYQSLTHSIFLSLIENQLTAPATTLDKDLSPVEKLLTNGKVETEVSPVEQLLLSNPNNPTRLPSTNPDTDVSAVENLLNSDKQEQEEFSPLAHILSTYSETLEEKSPIENLLTQPVFPSSDTLVSGLGSNGEVQVLSSNGQNGISDPYSVDSGNEVVTNSAVESALTTTLFGIYDGTGINFKSQGPEQLHADETVESPIENLLKAPVHSTHYSSAFIVSNDDNLSNTTQNSHMTNGNNRRLSDDPDPVVHNELPQEVFIHNNEFQVTVVNTNVLNGELNKTNIEGQLKGETFTASKLSEELNSTEEECGFFTKDPVLVNHDSYMENPEDIEIQAQQLSRFENPAILVGDGLGVKEATEIILTLGQAAAVLFDSSKKMSCEEIKKRHAEYLEQYMTKIKVFGSMSNISKEEYLDFYNQTGIDIDNRQQILIESLKYMEESINKMVKFAKAIPGFCHLDIDDQVNLVKVSRFEFWVIKLPGNKGCIKSAYQVATAPWDKEYHLEELQKLYPLEYLDQKVAISNEFLNHKLSVEETILIKAIVLTFPASRFEHDMIQFGQVGKCVKSSLKVATLPWNKEYHFDEISKIFPRNYCTVKIQNLQDVIQLGLSFEETVVLKALIITFPDRCELKEPEKVEYLHNRLIACFLFMLANRPPDKLVTVQAVLGTLFRIRRLAAWDTQIIQEMFEVWPVTSNHQLVKEFVS